MGSKGILSNYGYLRFLFKYKGKFTLKCLNLQKIDRSRWKYGKSNPKTPQVTKISVKVE